MKKLLALLVVVGFIGLTTGCPPAETPKTKTDTKPGGTKMEGKMDKKDHKGTEEKMTPAAKPEDKKPVDEKKPAEEKKPEKKDDKKDK